MNQAKIINQIDLKELTEAFTEDQLENALINEFLRNSDIKTNNKLLFSIIKNENKTVTEKVNYFLISRKINLDLMTLEKIFELMQGRLEKKKSGAFYTPHYIVDFMINNAIVDDCKVLDPSCGAGAFLVGAVKKLNKVSKKSFIDIIENNIFGVDISAKAISRSKLILTLCALLNGEDKELINFNLIADNSLLLNWENIFPEVFREGGFDVVIGNPPYAKLNNDYDIVRLKEKYEILSKALRPNLYLFFLELMIKISKKNTGRGAVIVPLSIAFNSDEASKKIRGIFSRTSGYFKFSFYDRSPDSLFGDNIKTRNSIIFFVKNQSQEFTLATTNLIRWNSRCRENLFESIVYQDLNGYSIREKIPKISKELEFNALKHLNLSKCNLGDQIETRDNGKCSFDNRKNIFYYSTAYNWLSIFRNLQEDFLCPIGQDEILPFKRIICKSESLADLLYPILNSKLVYWYWLVTGDGFHLTSSFIAQIPIDINLISECGKNKLIYLGDILSKEVKKYPISKVNNKKLVRNFNILKCSDILDQINTLLISELQLENNFKQFLDVMYVNHVSAGRKIFKNKASLLKIPEKRGVLNESYS